MNNALMEIGKRLVIRLSIDEREKHEALGIILSALEEAAQHSVQADGAGVCPLCGDKLFCAMCGEHVCF